MEAKNKEDQMTTFDELPEDCIAQILSLTSPRDVCSSMSLSWAVCRAAESDLSWENFLPTDYKEIMSRLVYPVLFKSKKELFMKMCSLLLIDGGTKGFSIERTTNKKCYKLGVRELSIPWSSNALYWCWKSSYMSSMREIVELITTSWLEINGTMSLKMLSPDTYYGAYLIIKFANHAYGLDSLPSELIVQVGDYKSQGIVYLRPYEQEKYSIKNLWTRHRSETLRSRVTEGERYALCEREDGWWEIEMGTFHCDGSNKEVKMSLKEIKGEHLKGGLIVEGIELRPKS